MRHWFLALACSALMSLVPAWAAPGDVLSLSPTGTLSPAEVDARTAGRFSNNGATPPGAQETVDSYLMTFQSTGLDGAPVEITAQLFVPRLEPQAAPPLFVFAPGSTGLVEACAPSRSFVDAGRYDTYNAYTLAYAGQGFVSVMPNYMGFFDVGVIQPYFVLEAEGRVMLDAIRAVPQALTQLGVNLSVESAFVGGFSQGGHAAFATADLFASYAPEVPLEGILGFGPTTGLAALFREFTYVSPWVVHSYNTFYPGRIDPAEIVAEPYLSSLISDAERLCIDGVQVYYPSSPGPLFQSAFTEALTNGTLASAYPEVAELFAENDAGRTGHGLPAIILQGVDDPVVYLSTQDDFVRQLCANGSAVRYPNYLNTRHETRYIGFVEAMEWMRALSSGEAPPDDCALVAEEP